MSTAAYAKKEYGAPGRLGKQAREAATVMRINKSRGKTGRRRSAIKGARTRRRRGTAR